MDLVGLAGRWPLLRQLRDGDHLGFGQAVRSRRTDELRPRTAEAERTVKSICPYCAVGCAQLVYVKDGQVIQIEGDPDSPISRGRLCPKGSASKSLVTSPRRELKVKYRRPFADPAAEVIREAEVRAARPRSAWRPACRHEASGARKERLFPGFWTAFTPL